MRGPYSSIYINIRREDIEHVMWVHILSFDNNALFVKIQGIATKLVGHFYFIWFWIDGLGMRAETMRVLIVHLIEKPDLIQQIRLKSESLKRILWLQISKCLGAM